MKKVIAIFAVSSLVMLTGCCKSGHGYKSVYIYNFIAACVQNGNSSASCACLMDVVQDKMGQKEFLDEDARTVAGKPVSDRFTKILEEGRTNCFPK